MKSLLKIILFTASVAFLVAPGVRLLAEKSEHPAVGQDGHKHAEEHPEEKAAKEKISKEEHPDKKAAGSGSEKSIKSSKKKTTIADVADAVRKFVTVDSKAKGGYFMVYDKVKNTPLALQLTKIHKDRLSSIGNNTYFVCADFDATDGKTYDIDLFMKENKFGKLKLSDVITVHKVNGKARYGWVKKDGVWKHSKK